MCQFARAVLVYDLPSQTRQEDESSKLLLRIMQMLGACRLP